MTKDNTQSFADAFQKFLKAEKLDKKFQEKQLVNSWEKIMGKTIASRTQEIFVRNKVLYLRLDSAPLKQEMINSKLKVIEIIAKEFGDGLVEDLRFF